MDRHFTGAISPRGERALRAHLGVCESCRWRYDRYLVLARLDRTVGSAEDRLAHGLGLAPRWRAWSRPVCVALSLAAMLVALHLRLPQPGYLARGGAVADPDQALYVYCIAADGEPRPVVDGVIDRRDELAFAYRNRSGWPRLLVYAVDETGRVYWYHPGWTDATATPVAVPIDSGPERHELPEAIAQPLPRGRIEIHAIFTSDVIGVRAIEHGARPARAEELVVPIDVTEKE